MTFAASGLCHFRSLLPPLSAPAVARNGRPGDPVATSVSGGGSGYRGNLGRACRNPCDAFPNRPRGQDGLHSGRALGLGDPLLPGADIFKGGPGPRPGAGDNGRNRPGRKGASHALALLRPGQRLLNPATYLRLPGRAACRGHLPSGGYPRRGLCGTEIRLRCAAS